MKSSLLNKTYENKTHNLQNMRSEILQRRYLRKDEQGNIVETEEQMFHRVANTIAAVEAKYGATDSQIQSIADEFYKLMANGIFLPNSPTLMNCGRENAMLSACFVLPIEDSIEGIFDAVKRTALIQKAGGGTGFSFDRLRPTGDRVASSGGTTSGPISFWRVLSETTSAIQQGAFRRGANMGMMSVEHPDILKFLNAKQDTTTFTNFNISVKVPDAFMKKLVESPYVPHVVVNPRTKKRYVIPHSVDISSYSIDDLHPEDQAKGEFYTVTEIWNMIVTNAHLTGEPGLCFFDRINRDNTTPLLGQIEASNPCGEQPLLPYEACTLGSINLAKFVTSLNGRARMDWSALAQTVRLAVRFLDNTIDVSDYPVEETLRLAQENRKIGLGIMGFADCLFLLGIPYDSERGVKFAASLMKSINEDAHRASSDLANLRGAFPNWDQSTWRTQKSINIRNASVTCIAPTGTISIIAGCSGGIEPTYSLVYERKVEGETTVIINPVFKQVAKDQGFYRPGLIEEILRQGSLKNIEGIPEKIKRVFVTALEIAPEWHIQMQAAFQEHCDAAVSKTINLSQKAAIADVDKAYKLAFELGCKGTTVYRDGSRENQVITTAHKTVQPLTNMLSPRPRARQNKGQTTKYRTGCGTLFVTVNWDAYGLCEVFACLGKAGGGGGGGCAAQTEGLCRSVSIWLRSGVDPRELIEQLRGIRCLSTIARRKTNKDISVVSCADAIAAAMEEALETLKGNCEHARIIPINKCPECGYPLRRQEGCNVCDNCWYTKCG